jgi:hypothetical protein
VPPELISNVAQDHQDAGYFPDKHVAIKLLYIGVCTVSKEKGGFGGAGNITLDCGT